MPSYPLLSPCRTAGPFHFAPLGGADRPLSAPHPPRRRARPSRAGGRFVRVRTPTRVAGAVAVRAFAGTASRAPARDFLRTAATIPVAHVEIGLRSFDSSGRGAGCCFRPSPWPVVVRLRQTARHPSPRQGRSNASLRLRTDAAEANLQPAGRQVACQLGRQHQPAAHRAR